MRFEATAVRGCWVVRAEPEQDERGAFARVFAAAEFEAHGIDARVAQCSISQNRVRGTLRGLHLQSPPHQEAKLVSCLRGRAHDVVVDLRPDSASYRRWHAIELSGADLCAVAIPAGCAHGFLTLEDDTVLHYQISVPHAPEAARGIRWNDPGLDLRWPGEPRVISARDAAFPDHNW